MANCSTAHGLITFSTKGDVSDTKVLQMLQEVQKFWYYGAFWGRFEETEAEELQYNTDYEFSANGRWTFAYSLSKFFESFADSLQRQGYKEGEIRELLTPLRLRLTFLDVEEGLDVLYVSSTEIKPLFKSDKGRLEIETLARSEEISSDSYSIKNLQRMEILLEDMLKEHTEITNLTK